jgi:lipopolysaccharide assembly protein A
MPGSAPGRKGVKIETRSLIANNKDNDMRYVYMALITVFAGIIILFKFQNLEAVTVTLFSASVTLPVSVLVLLIYVLGMLTGGFLLALLRTWVHGATRRY